MSAAPSASCFLRDTSDSSPATSDSPIPAQPPPQASREHPITRPGASGLPPGQAGRAARGGSHDNTTARALPQGPPAAAGGRAGGRRRDPARRRFSSRSGPASGCRQVSPGAGGPLCLLRRQRHHPSPGGSGEEKADREGGHTVTAADQHSAPTVGEPRYPLRSAHTAAPPEQQRLGQLP